MDSVSIDEGISFDDIAGLMKRFGEVTDETLVTHSLPVMPYTTAGGAAVLDIQEAAAQPVLDIFRGAGSDGVNPADVKVRVMNGDGQQGHAASVAEALGYVGFSISEVSGLDTIPLATSQVRFHPNQEEAARRLVDYLLSPAVEAKLAAGRSAQIPLNPNVDIEVRIATPKTVRPMRADFEAAAEKWDTAEEFLKGLFLSK